MAEFRVKKVEQRTLTMEKILLSEDFDVKVTDFTSSSPEDYDDQWSIILISFELLCARLPFGDPMSKGYLARVHSGKFDDFSEEEKVKVSKEYRDLVNYCLGREPRPTFDDFVSVC